MIATSIIVRAETRVAKRKEWVPLTDLEIQAQDWPFLKDKAAAVHFQKYNILSRPQVRNSTIHLTNVTFKVLTTFGLLFFVNKILPKAE